MTSALLERSSSAQPSAWPIHGDLDRTELLALGVDPAAVLDFSVCVNPFGPSPRVREALARTPLDRYPDRRGAELVDALVRSGFVSQPVASGVNGTRSVPTTGEILIGNGVSELIWLTCLAFLKPADRVLVVEPAYGEYARSAAMMGAAVDTLRTYPEDDFHIDSEAVFEELRRCRPRLMFLGNPSNPAATLLANHVIANWAVQWPSCLFVIDEAYMAFASRRQYSSLAGAAGSNFLVLRSMTKDFALAGLRLGFAVGAAEVIEALRRVQPPWSVNAMALAAGVAALGDLDHLERSLAQLADAKASLVAGLERLGLKPRPSATNFFLVRVGDGAAFRLALLKRGLLVRDAASFGLPEYIRIATRRPEDNLRLLAAIEEIRR